MHFILQIFQYYLYLQHLTPFSTGLTIIYYYNKYYKYKPAHIQAAHVQFKTDQDKVLEIGRVRSFVLSFFIPWENPCLVFCLLLLIEVLVSY